MNAYLAESVEKKKKKRKKKERKKKIRHRRHYYRCGCSFNTRERGAHARITHAREPRHGVVAFTMVPCCVVIPWITERASVETETGREYCRRSRREESI